MSYIKLKTDTWTKCKLPLFCVTILFFLFIFYILDTTKLDFKKSIRFIQVPAVKVDEKEGFVVKTPGCRIPFLDPFDRSILQYLYKPKPFKCSSRPPLILSNLTSVFVDKNALPFYNVTMEELKCCYLPFWRVDPQYNLADNFFGYGICTDFNSSTNIQDEFVKVRCTVNNVTIYKDFHCFITEKRKNQVLRRKEDPVLRDSGVDKLSVLMLGLDAISRLNLQRQMPKTVQYIKDKLFGIELVGYNKVGDNTFPNVVPILTGYSEEELTNLCWKNPIIKFDKCPFLWKNFSEAKYLTAFGEDSSWMGIFNYVKNGFQQQPTDYYWKTFNYLAEKEIGHTRLYNADLCIGTRPAFIVMLEYINKFIAEMMGKPFFSFFWGNSLSHDNLNFPSMGDETYKMFFKGLNKSNILNETVLIFLSDHGIRWGGIRSTHQGQLEERLPFIYFLFPNWFREKYPTAIANLRRNRRRLTTPYDLHETLVDILNIQNILPDNIRLRSKEINTQRGISLFLHIPENRTCSTAGIAAHWCTCQKSVEVNKTDLVVVKGAEFIVGSMNKMLEGYKACAKLHLDKIMDARLLKTDDFLDHNSSIYDYTIILKTVPGGGLFEGTVRTVYSNDNSLDITNITNSFQLTGTISRINLYGDTSSCVTDFHLKLYCYCGG